VYTYLSACLIHDKDDEDCSDVKIKFKMSNLEAQYFVRENIGKYDVVLMNTCPRPHFSPIEIYAFTQILKENGAFFIVHINPKDVTPDLCNRRDTLFSAYHKIVSSKFNKGPINLKNPTRQNGTPFIPLTANTIERMFYWDSNANNTIPFLRKLPYNVSQFTPVIAWWCERLKYDQMDHDNSVIINLFPLNIRKFMVNISVYCIESETGNYEKANKILNMIY